MKNKEIRKMAKEKMKGKMGKAVGITIVYFLLNFLMSLVLGWIPIIGSLAASIISVPLTFGWTKQIILLANGEYVGIIDFLKHGFGNFGKVWCSNLWITLKCIVPALLMIACPIVGSLVNEMLAIVLTIGGSIWLIIAIWKYAMINYTIAYDNQELRAKQLVEKTGEECKGKIGGFVCMGIYFGLLIFCYAFLITFVTSFAFGFFGSLISSNIASTMSLIGIFVSYIIVGAVSLVLSIRNVAACNEYYKIKVLGEQYFNNNQSDMNYEQNNVNY